MLIRIPGLLSKEAVAHCRTVLETAQWNDGSLTSGEQAGKVKKNLQIPFDSKESRELGDLVLQALGRNPLYNSAAMALRVSPPMFNRYDEGMEFGSHVDGGVRAIPNSNSRMRADLSSTLFLSEPDEYEGGELVIEDVFGTKDIKFEAGDLILYPTTSLHSVNKILSGSRWVCVFWTQSMIRNNDQRQILHELDNNIIQLRQTLPDNHPNVLGLVNIYHNLLRLWAEL